MKPLHPAISSIVLLALLAINGCFETELSLGSPDDSVVDRDWCGDWELSNPSEPDEKTLLAIRNIGGRRYFVGWSKPEPKDADDKPLYMIAHTTKVKDAIFAHVRDMPADGTVAKKHWVLRVELKDGELSLRNLDADFFKEQMPQTDADFKKLVEEKLDNADMYDNDVLVARRK